MANNMENNEQGDSDSESIVNGTLSANKIGYIGANPRFYILCCFKVMLCVCVLHRGHSSDGYLSASILFRYER